jgi:hypothetical protein
MKKIIATLVLLALLSAAVFAQDDGSGWKIGFKAQLVRDLFYTTKVTGEFESKGSTTSTGKLGDYIKGSSDLFTFTNKEGIDQRIAVSLFNNGEHHSVYLDLAFDNTWLNGSLKFNDILTAGSADWWFVGDTGGLNSQLVVFDAKVGTGRYGGFVPVYEIWDDYVGCGGYNFFGIQKTAGFQPSNNISATGIDGDGSIWNAIYAIGATFNDNIRFALGSKLDSFDNGFDNPSASASSVEAGFMFSGKGIADLLSFDLFYAINGEDKNTVMRGTGKWENLLGAYAGFDMEKLGIAGLGLSVGYTANFTQDETKEGFDGTDNKTYDITNPIWSGVDLNIKFSGIEKLGITFNNNVSFASVSGAEVKQLGDPVIMGLDGTPIGKDVNQNWFAYKASLAISSPVTDNLSVTLALRNLLTIAGADSKVATVETKSTKTTDDLVTSLHADYNAGNVTFGIGFTLGLESTINESETKSGTTVTEKSSVNTVRFGVPLFFKVAF